MGCATGLDGGSAAFTTRPAGTMSLGRLITSYAVADQNKTCATQTQALNPDKGDSVWMRRALVRCRMCHAGRHLFMPHTLEYLSHVAAIIHASWKTGATHTA